MSFGPSTFWGKALDIEITNWSKHNPRSSIKHPRWFALSNRILEDASLFDLSAEEFKAWIYVLCQASQANSNSISINPKHAERVCGLKPKTFTTLFPKLEKTKCIQLRDHGVNTNVHGIHTTLQDRTEQNTTEQNIALAPQAPNPVSVYCEAYKEKYKHNPVIGPKQSGILIRFSKNHPNRFEQLIRGYLQMPDSWAVARSHPVEILESKINEIVRFLETGKVVTKKVISHAEEMIDKAQGTNRRPRKPIEELERERAEMLADANGIPLLGGKA